MQRISEALIGATEAAEVLAVSVSNVGKLLARNGIDAQTVYLGPNKRRVKAYLRTEVEELRDLRAADVEARAVDEKRRASMKAKAEA